jgi:hypothetical protein
MKLLKFSAQIKMIFLDAEIVIRLGHVSIKIQITLSLILWIHY